MRLFQNQDLNEVLGKSLIENQEHHQKPHWGMRIKNLIKNLIKNQDLGQDLIEILIKILNEDFFSHWESQWESQWGLAQLPKILIFDEVLDEVLDFWWGYWWCFWFLMRFLPKTSLWSWFWNNLIEILNEISFVRANSIIIFVYAFEGDGNWETEARDLGCAHGSTRGLRTVWPMNTNLGSQK